MSGERSIYMVILSVDIGCNCASYSDELGSRGNGKKPSMGYDHFKKIRKQKTALARNYSLLNIE
jgi:hypothetical protein